MTRRCRAGLRRRSARVARRRQDYAGIFELNVEALYFEITFMSRGSWAEGVVLRLSDFDFSEVPFPVYLAGIAYVESKLVGPFTVTNTGDSIDVAWGGAGFEQGTYLKVFFPPSPVEAIPEPETWALMLVGLVGAGVGLRRRRRTR